MNSSHIQDLITALKEDKSCVQPYRNYAVKALHEALAFLEQGHRTSNLKTPPGVSNVLQGDDLPAPTRSENGADPCTCPGPGVVDHACRVHGV